MKKIIFALVLLVSGCSLMPISFDGSLFDNLVSTKIAVEKLNCDDKNWTDAEDKIHHLGAYASLRGDPQAKSIDELEVAIKKAKDSNNKMFCESILKINKTRLDVVADAWRGR